MKLNLTRIILFVSGMISMNAMAQETEVTPLDTLTNHVAMIRQELDVVKRIKLSGYIQTQFQYGDSTGAAAYNGGAFGAGNDKRFMIRRGRLKAQYDAPVNDKGISTSQYVLQFDVTENGLTIKDAYGKFTDPWSGWFSITAGMQNRPFGYEIPYSSSLRESPERGRMSQLIFPGERDLGAMLSIQGPKTSNWNWIKFDAGFFNGNGAPGVGVDVSDFDKKKDFISHLGINRTTRSEKVKYGIGVSYYLGGYRIDTVNVYKFGVDSAGVKAYVLDMKKDDIKKVNINTRDFAERMYIGADAQLSVDWAAGITTLRAEYIQGDQPSGYGNTGSTKSVNSNAPVTSDIYKRKFNGAYFYFLQNILQSPFQAIVKYDWYDPNTEIEGDAIGKSVSSNAVKTNATDLKFTTLGLGLAYRWDANVKLTAYYDMVTNETSNSLSGYTKDIKDNNFTLRMQVKF
ncbi:MAG TPA: porin [Bacteroidia bacterium]|nr:porin [Bacteroidia bacterium]